MVTVFVEGPVEESLLTQLLADLPAAGRVRIVAAGGRDDARPRARKELLVQQRPVILVIDADSIDRDIIGEQQRDLEDYFAWGAGGVPYRVLQFVPTVEAIFFDRPEVLEHLLGRKPDDIMLAAGEIAPKAVLQRMGITDLRDRVRALSDADLQMLRTHPSIAAIREFVEENTESTLLRKSA